MGLVFVCPKRRRLVVHPLSEAIRTMVPSNRAALFLGQRPHLQWISDKQQVRAHNCGTMLAKLLAFSAGLFASASAAATAANLSTIQVTLEMVGHFLKIHLFFLQIPVDHSCYKWPFKPTSPPYKLRQDIVAAGKNLLRDPKKFEKNNISPLQDTPPPFPLPPATVITRPWISA